MTRNVSLSYLIMGSLILLALAVAQFKPIASVPGNIAFVIVILTIGLWATGLLAEYLTAIIFFTLAMLVGIAPANVVFAGFASSAFWLVFAGLIIGMAVKQSGLGDRIAQQLASLFGTSYIGSVLGVVGFGIVMAFIMPSAMGRVVVMLPVLLSLAERLGYEENSRGKIGLILGGVLGSYLPAFAILPANVPNMVLGGTMEALYDKTPVYGEYLLQHFPFLGVLKSVLLIATLLFLYRAKPQKVREQDEPQRPWSPVEIYLSILLGTALLLWMTDVYHGISPAWIGMVVAVVCLIPGSGLLAPQSFQKINLSPVFYVAGIIGLGAVVSYTGIGEWVANWAVSIMPLEPCRSMWNFYALSGVTSVVGLLTTLPGVPAIMTPLASNFAQASGMSLDAVLITQVVGFSTVLLPYQAPPLIVAAQMANMSLKEMTRVCLILASLTIVLIWPLDYLWLSLLGFIS